MEVTSGASGACKVRPSPTVVKISLVVVTESLRVFMSSPKTRRRKMH